MSTAIGAWLHFNLRYELLVSDVWFLHNVRRQYQEAVLLKTVLKCKPNAKHC